MADRCDDIRALLGPWLDDDLPPVRRAAVDEHLRGCLACQAELDRERSVVEGLAGLPELACPEGLVRRIERAVTTEPESRPEPASSGWLGWARGVPGWRAAALAAAVVAVVLLLAPPSGPRYTDDEVLMARRQARASLAWTVRLMSSKQRDTVRETLARELAGTLRDSARDSIRDPLSKL